MRGLCNGTMSRSSNLNDIVMFLAMVRAMSMTLEADGCRDCLPEFYSDLSRWQILFAEDKSLLADFGQAVQCIWGVDVKADRQGPLDVSALASLQEIAVSLMSKAEVSFGLREGKRGLLEDPQDWRQNWQQENRLAREGALIEGQIPGIPDEPPERPTDYWDSGGDDPPFSGNDASKELHDEVRNDPAIASMSSVVVLLIAGAIFSIVLTFLSCKYICWISIDSRTNSS